MVGAIFGALMSHYSCIPGVALKEENSWQISPTIYTQGLNIYRVAIPLSVGIVLLNLERQNVSLLSCCFKFYFLFLFFQISLQLNLCPLQVKKFGSATGYI